MKKIVLAVSIVLLLALAFPSIPKVSATTTEDLRTAYAPPASEPTNSTTKDYLNTTNPYSDSASIQGALDEVDDAEGANPLYVLVFGDEEEGSIWRWITEPVGWQGWAKVQLERGDEALVANFGIDIRILGFLGWDSDDSKDTMEKLWYELQADTEQYLGQWYNGEAWSGFVDAIIGITAQATPGDNRTIQGLSSRSSDLDQGRIFTLLKWKVYWADDNLVQHEVSHLFYALDHRDYCCAMATHTHFVGYTWEDGTLWIVFNDVPCAYTSYDWCGDCYRVIDQKKSRYSVNLPPLTPSTPAGSTSGYRNVWYTYSTSTTDPNGNDIRYEFEFSGPIPTVSFTTGWYTSGETRSIIVMWETSDPPGTYYVRARAQDVYGEWSYWSPSLTVTILNRAPNIPSKPSGPTSGYTDGVYTYSTSTTDPDGDNVRYQFDWGDGSSTTMTGYGTSGFTGSASHAWVSSGTYYVKVRALDVYGEWSNWSPTLAVDITTDGDGGGGGGGGHMDLHPWSEEIET